MPKTIELVLPQLHDGQRQVFDSPARFKVLACGRRWGKSVLALAECLSYMRKTNGRVWYVAPNFRMVDLHWRTLKSLLPHGVVTYREQDKRASFPNGAEISFRSADDPDSLRGVGLDFLVVDEAAFVPNLQQAWTAALRATLSDRGGSALFISTPNGYDFFNTLYGRGQDPGYPEWQSWCFPTATNPYIADAEVLAAKAELPDRIFRQEYLAEFITDGGQVFRCVDACVHQDGEHRGPYVIGVDWGKRDDFTVFTIADRDTGRIVAVERMNQIDYRLQTERLKALCAKWNPELVLAEQNSIGDPIIETLLADDLPVRAFTTTNASKNRIIEALAVSFERGEISLPEDHVLIGELKSFTVERLPGGSFRYAAPSGCHDDCVMSLALAWEARGNAAMSWGWV